MAVVIVGMIAFDHVGLLGATGNDWLQFDKQTFAVTRVVTGDEILIRADGHDIPVHLLGTAAPDAGLPGNAESLAYAKARLAGRSVTLRLEATQTRDGNRHLLAYVYPQDNDNFNLDEIRDGKAYADRRTKHTFETSFDNAESDARKKSRGLWDGLRTQDMPAWRLQWLKDFFATRRPTSRPAPSHP